MICYFRKGLKPSIKIEIEQQDQESMNFEEMVQRTVNAKANTGLRSSTMIQDLDIRCPKGHYSSNSTALKVQTQGTTAKNSYSKEPKIKEVRPSLFRSAEATGEPLE